MRPNATAARWASLALVSLCCSCAPVDDFHCAAVIAAADKLMSDGRLPADQAFRQRALTAAMAHLNAYAIPKNIGEKEAFAQVKAERDSLLKTLTPQQVVDEANVCIDN